ncbi:MAG: hypothetical protein C0425_04475 [Chlorobiaceae bacterium]|nr:hypothetical protein [Chlorobiaceae bacterium]MBA4309571.1 hypothetical protein [Chlorobiaceae bacterium]
MKTRHIFWGTFLMLLGILFLLDNILHTGIEIGQIHKFWPAVLVLIGLSLIVKNNFSKILISIIAAIFLALLVFSLFNWDKKCYFFHSEEKEVKLSVIDSLSEPFDAKIKRVNFDIGGGASKFILSGNTDEQFLIKANNLLNNYEVTTSKNLDELNLQLKRREMHVDIVDDFQIDEVKVFLNPNPIYNFNFEIGAASCELDLTTLRFQKIDAKIGAASLKLILNEIGSDSAFVNIEAGAASVNISMPKTAAAQINSETALASKNFEGFIKISENVYRTSNFETANKKIFLNLKGGVSSLSVKQF